MELSIPPPLMIPKVRVHIVGYAKEGVLSLVCLYANENDGRTYETGWDFEVDIPLGSLFFVGPEISDVGYTPTLSEIRGIVPTYDRLQDSEAYFGTMRGYVIMDPNGEHSMYFSDH